jgi:hypothetical protein
MGIKMPEEVIPRATVDPFYWERLLQMHPTDVCNRSEAFYNPSWQGFVLPVYHQRYLTLPREKKIFKMAWNDQRVEEEVPFFLSLMILVYLIEARTSNPPTWVSERRT